MVTTPSAVRPGIRRRLTTLLSCDCRRGLSLGVLPGTGADAAPLAGAPLAGAPLAGAPLRGRSLAGAEHVVSSERDCYEFNEIVLVPMATLRANVPARYAPQSWPEDPKPRIRDLRRLTHVHHDRGRTPHARSQRDDDGPDHHRGRERSSGGRVLRALQATDNLLLVHRIGGWGSRSATHRQPRQGRTRGRGNVVHRHHVPGRRYGSPAGRDRHRAPAEPVVEVSSAPFYATGPLGEVRWIYVTGSVHSDRNVHDGGWRRASVPRRPWRAATMSGQTGFLRGGWDSERH
jgi:hypothetical protein